MKSIVFPRTGHELKVGKILCLGRNYAEHVAEMAAEVTEFPIVFLKPATALVPHGGCVVIPSFSRELHHEVEMVIVIGCSGKHIPPARAQEHIAGYAVGLDMTLRDIQAEAKRKGTPWSIAKGFDTSAPVSPAIGKSMVPDPHCLDISLTVNGELRQRGNTREMLHKVDGIIAYISSIFTLEAGDLIFTGTPAGVGPVRSGDRLRATLGDLAELEVTVRTEDPSSGTWHG